MLELPIKALIIIFCLQFQLYGQKAITYTGGEIAKLTGILYRRSEKDGNGKVIHYTCLHLDSPITLRKDPLDESPEDTEPIVADIKELLIDGKDVQKIKQATHIEAEGILYFYRGHGAPSMAIKSATKISSPSQAIINSANALCQAVQELSIHETLLSIQHDFNARQAAQKLVNKSKDKLNNLIKTLKKSDYINNDEFKLQIKAFIQKNRTALTDIYSNTNALSESNKQSNSVFSANISKLNAIIK